MKRATREQQIARFWSLVSIGQPSECWNWRGGKYDKKNGYGRSARIDGEARAHRISWSLANDSTIAPGLLVMHSCDNHSCVNPAHLSVGTNADNVRDRDAKARSSRGESHPKAVLTIETVRLIKQMRAEGIGCAEASRRLGIKDKCVSEIYRGRNWKHVTYETQSSFAPLRQSGETGTTNQPQGPA